MLPTCTKQKHFTGNRLMRVYKNINADAKNQHDKNEQTFLLTVVNS